MKGTLYGVGIGPGDPKLMTFRAAELIRDNEIIALPGEKAEETVAYQIAVQTVEELKQKTFLELPMPMTKDRAVLEDNHNKAADAVESYLKQGKNVVFLTLGDPTVYSTYLYVHHRLVAQGYETEIVCGITSFCAVSARLNTGLVEKAEPLHVIPASYQIEDALKLPGTKVLMKAGKKMKDVKAELEKTNNVEAAAYLGTVIAKKAIEKGITSVVFDRGGFIYHGKIKALADAAREAGLNF